MQVNTVELWYLVSINIYMDIYEIYMFAQYDLYIISIKRFLLTNILKTSPEILNIYMLRTQNTPNLKEQK